MYEKYIFSKNDLMYFLLMWSMSICNVTCDLCPEELNDGYIEPSCSRLSGVWCDYSCNRGFDKTYNWLLCGRGGNWLPLTNSVCIKSDLCPLEFNGGYIEISCSRRPGARCNYYCDTGFFGNGGLLTCVKGGNWIPDTNSLCIKSVEQTSSDSKPRRASEGNVGVIVGITTAALIVMMIIVAIVVWISKRSSVRKSQRRVPGHTGGTCLRPRETRDQNVTTLRQQPNADGIVNVSSFESPSYNDLYVHSFVQRIPTISSSYNYPEPPPSYSETQIPTNESPPTYTEVVTDPTRFNLYI